MKIEIDQMENLIEAVDATVTRSSTAPSEPAASQSRQAIRWRSVPLAGAPSGLPSRT